MKLYCYKSENYESWSALIRNGDDEDTGKFLALTFKKGEAPKGDRVVIETNEEFLSTFVRKDGTIEFKLVVLDYDVVDTKKQDKKYKKR